MRIGTPDKYTVEGVVFLVSPKWGPRKVHEQALAAVPEPEAQNLTSNLAYKDAIERVTLTMLDSAILGIEGLVGEGDEEITEWSHDLWNDLPEPFLNDLVSRIMQYEADGRSGEVEKPTEPPPETTTEEDS